MLQRHSEDTAFRRDMPGRQIALDQQAVRA
jgi:hypothetical protein